jgi:hypothetical protein
VVIFSVEEISQVINAKINKTVIIDVTVISPLSTQVKSYMSAGEACSLTEKKIREYRHWDVNSQGNSLVIYIGDRSVGCVVGSID